MDEFKRRICAVGLSIGLLSTQLPIALATDSPLSESEAITETSRVSEERTKDLEGSRISYEGDESSEDDSELPILYFKAINPGYTDNIGEMIEIQKSTNESVSLSGVVLKYSNSSGVVSDLVEFLDGARLDGNSLVLRYKAAADVDEKNPLKNANLIYDKTLAKSAGLELVVRDGGKEKTLDSICWTGKTGCYDNFSKNPDTTLVFDDEDKEFSFQNNYEPEFSADALFTPTMIDDENMNEDSDSSETDLMPQCLDVEFSEILSYYEDETTEQFIELYNSTDEDIPLDGCKIRYKKKNYPLSGMILAGGYYVYRPTDFHLTKNPNTENVVELVDVTENIVDTLTYKHGQKKGTSYAFIKFQDSEEVWLITYKPTPGEKNDYQEFRTCEAGKIINPATGNCVNVSSSANGMTEECPEGKYRNPLTGRCKSYETTKTTTCPEGKYKNPLTGRCKSYETNVSTATPCKEGYERNPETNRCRKIKANNGADYSTIPITGTEEKSSFMAKWALMALGGGAGSYTVFQYRKDIWYKIRELLAKIRGG